MGLTWHISGKHFQPIKLYWEDAADWDTNEYSNLKIVNQACCKRLFYANQQLALCTPLHIVVNVKTSVILGLVNYKTVCLSCLYLWKQSYARKLSTASGSILRARVTQITKNNIFFLWKWAVWFLGQFLFLFINHVLLKNVLLSAGHSMFSS